MIGKRRVTGLRRSIPPRIGMTLGPAAPRSAWARPSSERAWVPDLFPLDIGCSRTKSNGTGRLRGPAKSSANGPTSYPCCSHEDVAMKHSNSLPCPERPGELDLDDLLHPARAFDRPHDVVNDPDLTVNEKRAVLASWASDACAVEAAPALRCAPGASRAVAVDEILEALRQLDRAANATAEETSWTRRQLRRGAVEAFRRRRSRGQVDQDGLAY